MLGFVAGDLALTLLGIAIFRGPVRRDYRRLGRLSFASTVLETLAFGCLAGWVWLFQPHPWPAPDAPRALAVAGWGVGAAGVLVLAIALAELGAPRSFGRDARALRVTGLYRFSRNPQVVGFELVVCGAALLAARGSAAVWAGSFGLLAHVMILTEEEHLARAHPEAFAAYRARVRRYLGRRRPGTGPSAGG